MKEKKMRRRRKAVMRIVYPSRTYGVVYLLSMTKLFPYRYGFADFITITKLFPSRDGKSLPD